MYDGIVISGGSFKGISILGALLHMEEHDMLKPIKHYAGTSIGAIIVILMACEIPIFEIFSFVYYEKQFLDAFVDMSSILTRVNTGMGMMNIYETFTYKVEKFIMEKKGWKKLPTLKELYEEHEKDVAVVTTREMATGRFEKVVVSRETFPDISILRAMEMSSNLPWLFTKLKIGESFYVDGGFSDDFPYTLLREKLGEQAEILGLFIKDEPLVNESNAFSFTYRLITYPITQLSENQISLLSERDRESVVYIKTQVNNPANFHLDRDTRMQFFTQGYLQGKQKIKTYQNK